MTNQKKLRTNEGIRLSTFIEDEFSHMETNSTIGGAIDDFVFLLKKLQTVPQVYPAIIQAENQIVEEDKRSFEALQKSVDWIQDKLRTLMPFLQWEKGSQQMSDLNEILRFQYISLSPGGYLGALMHKFRQVASEVVQNSQTHPVFEGWAKVDRLGSGEYCILEFTFPDYLEQEIKKPTLETEIYEWKKRVDTSLPTLYRYLKILTLYDSFAPLIISANPSSSMPPKNLQELEQRQYQAIVRHYLSLFKSANPQKHPITIEELSRLVKRLVFLLQKEISLPTLKGPALKSMMSSEAEKYCVRELIDHVRNLSDDELKEFKKLRYSVEITNFLSQKAEESNLPFANSITPTMVEERAGPSANRILFEKYRIVWHPIPKNRVGSNPLSSGF